LRKITANGIDAWVADMIRAGELAPATVAAIKFLLSSLLKNAALDGYLDTNPAALTRVPVHVPDSEYRVLTRAEVRRLLAEIPEHYRPLFYLIVQTGLRWAEAAGMRVQDVDLDSTDPGMWVRQTLRRDGSVKATPKNRKARYVPFSDEVVKALRPLVEGRKGAALVFTSAPNRLGPGGNPLDYHNVRRRVFAPAVERAALADPQPTIHDLRHTAATFLAASGIRAHQLRDMLGHRDMRTLDRYLHSGNDDHAEIRRAMSEGAS
jgi:integrase